MEKKGKIILIGTMVLTIIIVFGGGYLLYDKVLKKEDKIVENTNTNTNTNIDDEQSITLDVNSDLVKNLPYLDVTMVSSKTVTSDTLPFSLKYELAFTALEKDGITLKCDLNTMKEYGYEGNDLSECFAFIYEIPEATLEKAIQKTLGKNVTVDKSGNMTEFNFKTNLKYKDLQLEKGLEFFNEEEFSSFIGSSLSYDKSRKVFVGTFETQGGGYGPEYNYYDRISATKKEKQITVVEKRIYTGGSYNVYADKGQTTLLFTLTEGDFDDMGGLINYKKYLENGTTITYIFEENEDGSYHFVSSERDK